MRKNKKQKSIVFTGGGTAGHVTPNLALIEALEKKGWKASYIGSIDGIEKKIIQENTTIPYYGIHTGKLRRYFSWKTFIEPFYIFAGIFQAYRLIHKLKPNIVFSKGGFVAVPVVIAAFLQRIPIIAHESDLSPGLANRLCYPFVTKIGLTFAGTKKYFAKSSKTIVTGTPIRASLFEGDADQAYTLCGFDPKIPSILVMGGGSGAQIINTMIRQAYIRLSEKYQIIHICGPGKLEKSMFNAPRYYQCEFANASLPHFFAAASLVISRSGANSLYEILALNKPHILVPLSRKYSRGDQIENAAYFEKLGVSHVIQEADFNVRSILLATDEVMSHQKDIIDALKVLHIQSGTQALVECITSLEH